MARPRALNKTGHFHVEGEPSTGYSLVFEYGKIKKIICTSSKYLKKEPFYKPLTRQGFFYRKRKLEKEFEFFADLLNIDV